MVRGCSIVVLVCIPKGPYHFVVCDSVTMLEEDERDGCYDEKGSKTEIVVTLRSQHCVLNERLRACETRK